MRRQSSAPAAADPSRRLVRRSGSLMHDVLVYGLLTVGAIVFLLPLMWMITTGLKSLPEIYQFPPTVIPQTFRWENFVEGWNYPHMNFPRWTLNSIILSGSVVAGVLLTSSLCAYGFARIRFPGRDFWFLAILASIMMPGQVTLIPVYIAYSKIGWLDTFKPLIVPAFFGGGAFSIFLLRQMFKQIPLELEDAAFIDGANRWQIWWRIFLPLSKPALATVVIFAFQGTWNDFYGPLIFLSSSENFTLALGLNMFRGMFSQGTPIQLMMAMSFLLVVPMVVVFFAAQNLMIRGVVMTGIKA